MGKLTTFLVCVTLGIQCSKPTACWQKGGEKERISIGSGFLLDSLTVGRSLHVQILFDSLAPSRVEVEGPQDFLQALEANWKGNHLTLENELKCKWVKASDSFLKVYLRVPSLQYLETHGGGEITGVGVNATETFVYQQWDGSGDVKLNLNTKSTELILNTGPGDVIVEGNTEYLFCFSGSEGQIDASRFQALGALISHEGVGDIHVNVMDNLTGKIHWIGNVYYHGNPVIQWENLGKGRLISAN